MSARMSSANAAISLYLLATQRGLMLLKGTGPTSPDQKDETTQMSETSKAVATGTALQSSCPLALEGIKTLVVRQPTLELLVLCLFVWAAT
jgi:hypothetical protein